MGFQYVMLVIKRSAWWIMWTLDSYVMLGKLLSLLVMAMATCCCWHTPGNMLCTHYLFNSAQTAQIWCTLKIDASLQEEWEWHMTRHYACTCMGRQQQHVHTHGCIIVVTPHCTQRDNDNRCAHMQLAPWGSWHSENKRAWLPFALVMSLCHSLWTFAQTALLWETLLIVTASGVCCLSLLTFF